MWRRIDQAVAAIFRFLRHASAPSAPIPAANNGSAAGNGTADVSTTAVTSSDPPR
jgi:hypothetical protein